MGFSIVLYKLYCIMKKKVFIFFYINNIIFIFRKNRTGIIKGVVRELKIEYQFIGGREFQWFLGI